MGESEKVSPPPAKCVAVIQCHVAHERCTGAQCAAAFARRRHAFEGYGAEAVFFVPFSCGGCPGRRVGRLVKQLLKVMARHEVAPAETVVHLSSCMVTDNAHYGPCPHLEDIRRMLARQGLRVREGSHFSRTAEEKRRKGIYRTPVAPRE